MKKRRPPKRRSASSGKRATTPQYFVGIGASAGGLEALRAVFASLERVHDLTFIVVQHLAPQHRSRLVELLAMSSLVPVKEATEGVKLDPGVIYVTPPNRDVFLEDGYLRLRPPHMKVGPKPSIDLFFQSLAQSAGERAIGVILSGTGSDGALGIRAIKAAGGITIAQNIESAKYDGMPKAAKQTGLVDMELTPEEIARELERVRGHRLIAKKSAVTKDPDPYEEILRTLETQEGVNFSLYKQSTIRRRIDRRVIATRSNSVEEYAAELRQNKKENRLLYQDILISVTSFFRDPLAFRAFQVRLADRISEKPSTSPLRCWVVGCATGEEAYSVAIAANEACDRLNKPISIQIFATDLDEHALGIARKGIYSKASLIEMPKPLQERYFTVLDDSRVQVKSFMRDNVIFAKHNCTQDPPFLALDAVTCRNVLIYFTNTLQDRVFKILHYALDKRGVLFLGKSEAVGAENDGFTALDSKSKIYQRLNQKGELPRAFSPHEAQREAILISKEKGETTHLDLFTSMIAGFAPHSVIVDEETKILHVYGKAGNFLNLPSGEASYVVTKLLSPEMSTEAASLLHRVQKANQAIVGRKHFADSTKTSVQMTVAPLHAGIKRTFLIAFTRSSEAKVSDSPSAHDERIPPRERIRMLDKELSEVREQLQTVIEEQETSNEELQSLNEELQSANEELQSSNEELETTNEELQSTNEELTTLNEELNVKTTELQSLNQTLQAIQQAIISPLVILDKDLRLVSFNAPARYLMRLSDQDIGSPTKVIPAFIDLNGVNEPLQNALKRKGESTYHTRYRERSLEVQMQAFPQDRGVEGVVLSFVDNTEIATALAEASIVKQRLTALLDNTPAIVTMKDISGIIIYANRRFCDLVGKTSDEVIGLTMEDLFGTKVGEEIRDRDYEVIKKRASLQFEERLVINGETCWWASSKFPILDEKRRVYSICTISLDVTDRVAYWHQLELFKKAVSNSTSGIMICEERGKTCGITYLSDELERLAGIEKGTWEAHSLPEILGHIFPKLKESKIEEIVKQINCRPFHSVTLPKQNGDKERWLEIRSFKPEATAEKNNLILFFIDATQTIEAQKTIAAQQEELYRFGRFASLGEVAAGIAHEINTPLNVITTKTDFLRKLTEMNKLNAEQALKASGEIDQMAKTISRIVTGLKSLVVKDSAQPERTNLNRLILDTLTVCENRLGREGIELIVDLPKQDIFQLCFAVQISQILINLVNNSIDAIADVQTKKWIKVELSDRKQNVELSVTDCGRGIDKALAEKIMTPFFTTKKDGHGTGIGLSLSRTIARRHKGDLYLDLHNKNTSFKLELPKKVALEQLH